MSWFISHNSADKAVARSIGTLLLAQKVDVWVDEWKILPGQSVVHEMTVGLDQAQGLLLLWSKNAAVSVWVDREVSAALVRKTNDPTFAIVPIVLDETPMPTLLSDLACVEWHADRPNAMVQLLGALGKTAVDRRSILRGLNDLLEELEIRNVNPDFGVVACRKCGGEKLRTFVSTDDVHDRRYLCIQCEECDWEDGGEI